MQRRAERAFVMMSLLLVWAGCSSHSGAKTGSDARDGAAATDGGATAGSGGADATGTGGGDAEVGTGGAPDAADAMGDISSPDAAAGTSSDAASDAGADALSEAGADAADAAVGGPIVLSASSFSVAVEGESTQCVVLDLGNAEAIHVGEIKTTISDVVYELRISKVAGAAQTTPTSCTPFGDLLDAAVTPIVFAKNKNEDLLFPSGVGYTLAAHQLLRFEIHASNLTGAAKDATATATFTPTPAATFQHEAGLLWVEAFGVNVPPRQFTILGPLFFPLPSSLSSASLFRAEGYTHKLGDIVIMGVGTSAADPARIDFYNAAGFVPDTPLVITKTPPLVFPSPAGIFLSCAWNNPMMGVSALTVTRGPSVDDERCAGALSYFPAVAAHACLQMGSGVAVTVCCPGGAGC
jgi:hypothetical protein